MAQQLESFQRQPLDPTLRARQEGASLVCRGAPPLLPSHPARETCALVVVHHLHRPSQEAVELCSQRTRWGAPYSRGTSGGQRG